MIELLAALGILAVLATLTLGMLSRVRSGAQSAASLGNLRQIGVGMSLYCAEHGGRYPPDWDGARNATWRDVLSPYLDGNLAGPRSIFVSPTSVLPLPASNTRPATYAVNGEMMWAPRQLGQDEDQPPVTTTRVKHPARVIVVADAGQSAALQNSSFASFTAASGWWYWNPDPGPWLDDPIPVVGVDPATGTEPGGAISYRDRGHAACLMADGHARRFARGEIKKRHLVFAH